MSLEKKTRKKPGENKSWVIWIYHFWGINKLIWLNFFLDGFEVFVNGMDIGGSAEDRQFDKDCLWVDSKFSGRW